MTEPVKTSPTLKTHRRAILRNLFVLSVVIHVGLAQQPAFAALLDGGSFGEYFRAFGAFGWVLMTIGGAVWLTDTAAVGR